MQQYPVSVAWNKSRFVYSYQGGRKVKGTSQPSIHCRRMPKTGFTHRIIYLYKDPVKNVFTRQFHKIFRRQREYDPGINAQLKPWPETGFALFSTVCS